MFDKIKNFNQYFTFYDLPQLQLKKDYFLNSDLKSKEIEIEWLKYINHEDYKHPNSISEYFPFDILRISNDELFIRILMQRNDRWHTIKISLPISIFRVAYLAHTSETRAQIVVKEEWFKKLKEYSYSVYCIIDFIDMKKILSKLGSISAEQLNRIKYIVDVFATANPDYIFMSFADNILIKTNWKMDYKGNTTIYNPEKLLRLIQKLRREIKLELGIDSYSIVSQGANYVDENFVNLEPIVKNHFFLPSLSTSFIEIFEIDNDIRNKIKSQELKRSEVYLENSFYQSTNRKFDFGDEPNWHNLYKFYSRTLKIELEYSALSFEQCSDLIEF